MTRSVARELSMHAIFELSFSGQDATEFLEREMTPEQFELRREDEPLYEQFPDEKQLAYITRLVRGISAHGAELDGYIEKYAKGWRFSRIDRVAVAIMRLAMYEVLYMPDVPNGAAINEAVEISKKYVDDDVVKFINGILGTFVRTEFPEESTTPPGEEK